ncbi:WD40-repeat-containing domain protein [Armillaria nabsnona]|nr:WD40-repeat-containing domain protein [Armillaria nabsnona]
MSAYEDYELLTCLEGNGAVNALAFWQNGQVLISGGDDQTVRCWDLRTGTCCQTVKDHRWGQVVAIDIMNDAGPNDSLPAVLFVGTGRGIVSLIPMSKRMPGIQSFLQEFNTQHVTTIEMFADSVEAQALDPINRRFAVASYAGTVKVYLIQDYAALTLLWEKDIGDIPRHVSFYGNNNDELLIHTLYNSESLLFGAQSGDAIAPALQLSGGIGSATLSPDHKAMAVHNLVNNNFDLYRPIQSIAPIPLDIGACSRLPKKSAFAEENARMLVCGGEDGTVHIFDVSTGKSVQTLEHDSDTSTIYAVATYSSQDQHLLASRETGTSSQIYVWSKLTDLKIRKKQQHLQQEINEAEAAKRAAAVEAVWEARMAQLQAEGAKVYLYPPSEVLVGIFGLFMLFLLRNEIWNAKMKPDRIFNFGCATIRFGLVLVWAKPACGKSEPHVYPPSDYHKPAALKGRVCCSPGSNNDSVSQLTHPTCEHESSLMARNQAGCTCVEADKIILGAVVECTRRIPPR